MELEFFKQAFSPQNEFVYALQEQRCHRGKAPSIMAAVAEFGIEAVGEVVGNLVDDFVSFTPARSRFSDNHRRQICWVIITQYRSMKITQLMLFFVKCKSGFFGKFYTNIEPMDITIALSQWQEICDKELSAMYYERARAMKDEDLEEVRAAEESVRQRYESVIVNQQYVLKF